MLTRFVILATPRCGSNWLCSLLDSHPQILCHHELFNPNGIHVAQSWRVDQRSLSDLNTRKNSPLEVLKQTWQQNAGFYCVGFKLNIEQSPAVFSAVLADPGIRKILIRRRNRIRAFLSEKIAETTGQWESYPESGAPVQASAIEIDLDALHAQITRNDDFYNDIQQRLRKSGQTALPVEYETLAQGDQQRNLLKYLDVHAEEPLQAATRKMNLGSLDEMISNYDQLNKQLQGTDLAQDLHMTDYLGTK